MNDQNPRVMMHEQVLLGNSLAVIIAETNSRVPSISEYQFKREVLDLLCDPFSQQSLHHYTPYVVELTRELRVVEDGNAGNVLFTVPALVMTPRASMAGPGGFSAESFFKSLTRDIDLGGARVNDKIVNYLKSITQTPDYVQTVLNPIRLILQRYGRDFVQAGPTAGLAGQGTAQALSGAGKTTQSFGDEYEDE